MLPLPFTYAARRRALERRRRSVEADPERATPADVVDLLRRQGASASEARWVSARACETAVPTSAAWSRLRRRAEDEPDGRPSRADLLAVALGRPRDPGHLGEQRAS